MMRIGLAAICLALPVPALALSGTEMRLTTDPANQFSPAVSGDLVVYTDNRNGNADIYMYDLSTGVETQLTSDTTPQILQDVDGGIVVYTDFTGGNAEIYLIDTATLAAQNITNDPATQQNPVISGGVVAWEDNRNGNDDIYAYVLSSATTQPVATESVDELRADVDGKIVVWEQLVSSTNSDLFMRDLGGTGVTRITNDSAAQVFPNVDGDYIVWQDNRNGNWDIFLYDLTTGVETQLTSDPSDQRHPRVSGNLVVWEDNRNGNSDLYGYDISAGSEFMVTNHPANQTLHDIDGRRIVYTDDRNGDLDIYMFEIDPIPVDPDAFCSTLGDLATWSPTSSVEVALLPTQFERMTGPPVTEAVDFEAGEGEWVTCIQNGSASCEDSEGDALQISFVTDGGFSGVDDTTGFTTSNLEEDTVPLGTSSLSLGKGTGSVTAWQGDEPRMLTHRGNRGLGVAGQCGPDEFDEIDSYSGTPERIEVSFEQPQSIHYVEVRSLFTSEQPPGTEQGDIAFYLDGTLVYSQHMSGGMPLGMGEGEMGFEYLGADTPVADTLVFRVAAGQPYTSMSEFSVARIETSPSGGPCKRVSSARVWLDGDPIAGPSDFNQNVASISGTATLAGEDHSLEARLTSSPGSYIWVAVARPSLSAAMATGDIESSGGAEADPAQSPEVHGMSCAVSPRTESSRLPWLTLLIAGLAIVVMRRLGYDPRHEVRNSGDHRPGARLPSGRHRTPSRER